MLGKLSSAIFLHRRWKWITLSALFCVLLAGMLISTSFTSTTASANAILTSPSGPSRTCQANSTVAAQDAFFTENFTITNTSSKTLHGWKVQILFSNKLVLIATSNGVFSQKGNRVIVKNTPATAVMLPGSSISPSFNGVWNNTDPNPISVKLNGKTCSLV
jgi:cellulose 1,4-beta-cellobiosidase